MASETFNQIENDIPRWIAERTEVKALREQIEKAEFNGREYTGAGFYTNMRLPPESTLKEGPITSSRWINGPDIESLRLEYGALSLIFCNDGSIDFLEIAAYGNEFPEDLKEYKLVDVEVKKI